MKKQYEKLVKENSNGNKIEYVIGFTKNKGKGSVLSSDKTYSIKNADDFKNSTFKQLLELSRRRLSTPEPSIDKLQLPISEDPNISEVKRERGYVSPDKISYSQTSYR
jgi:hypothetical protein